MSNRKKTEIELAFHLMKASEILENIDNGLAKELASISYMRLIMRSLKSRLTSLVPSEKKKGQIALSTENTVSEYKFDHVMRNLRNLFAHSNETPEDVAEIDWLIRLLLTSPALFSSIQELDNFLSNLVGISIKSRKASRERLVAAYLRHVDSLSDKERRKIYHGLAKYIFVGLPSNYKKWKTLLYSDKE